VYGDVLRFKSEESELAGSKERAVQARSLTDANDSALSEFTQTLRDFQTKLLVAANGTMSKDNLEAVATELEEQKKHMISLANSQMNGQYLFSGSATNTKPIDNEGKYHGNDKALMTLVGNGVEIQSNVDGQSLFLGDDLNVHKTVQTNVRVTNQISDEPLTAQSSIKEMIGDEFDSEVSFFISGVKSDGEAFKDIVKIQPDAKIEDLLEKIKTDFGGDVKVELTDNGNIEITDLKSGYSQIDFKMVGVQGASADTNLNAVTGDKIISFSKSDYKGVDEPDSFPTKEDELKYDLKHMEQQYFEKSGGKLEGNVALIADGSFVTSSTKLDDIANGSLDGKTFSMKVTDIEGNSKDVELKISDTSTFKVGNTTYNIYNSDNTPTKAKDFTIAQLNNIISMSISNKLPTPNDSVGFNTATKDAKELVDVGINQKGHLEIKDKSENLSKIEFAMYDNDANDFSETSTPTISFNSNNAVTIEQSHVSIFDELDSIIDAVRNGVTNLDSNAKDSRSIGIQNAIGKLDQISNHFNNAQSQIGIRSKSLQIAQEKASALELNVMQLKAETTEVDMAETIMKLNQTTLSYQAMLQTVTKVNSLSLLNYMK
jgi:flagellar hook-associated protein 3 FlgL